jgi:signal transduction histidine kinase
VLAWAVAAGPLGGGIAGLSVAAADLIERWSAPSEATVNGVVLLLLGGLVVGYVVQLARQAQAQLTAAVEIEAARRERDRLAARIHDGVLQVLALVARRGREIGGDGAELGRLAEEQEVALRTLIAAAPQAPTPGETDVRGLLASYEGPLVSVAAPAHPVLLAIDVARDLADAVGAALDNVAHHAGPDARAWVLVEDDGSEVVVTVRDDGRGFAADRLQQAFDDGRLGVARSIQARVHALGGAVELTSAPGEGTEVELRVPRGHRG